MTSLDKLFVTFGLIAVLCAFAGCEPVGNNNGNASNSGGNSPSTGGEGGTNPTDPANPDSTAPTEPGTTTGNWKVEEWQAWYGVMNGAGFGLVPITLFIEWANQYFPNGIPRHPMGDDALLEEPYSEVEIAAEWDRYFSDHPDVLANFPTGLRTDITINSFHENRTVYGWSTFWRWYANYFLDEGMPCTPPDLPTQSSSLATPAAPSTPGEIVDDLLGTTPTTDRSLEDAGMTEIQP